MDNKRVVEHGERVEPMKLTGESDTRSWWSKHGALILFVILAASLLWNCAFSMWFVYLWGKGVI